MKTFLNWLEARSAKPKPLGATLHNLYKSIGTGACGGKPCSIVGSKHIDFYNLDNKDKSSFTKLPINEAEVLVENRFIQQIKNPLMIKEDIEGVISIQSLNGNNIGPIETFIKNVIAPELRLPLSSFTFKSQNNSGASLQDDFNKNGRVIIKIIYRAPQTISAP
jgi:hypothetical protein